MGRRTAGPAGRAARHAARGGSFLQPHGPRPSRVFRPPRARGGRGGRPAGRRLRQCLPARGHGQEHLRHGLFPAAEHRRAAQREPEQPAGHRGLGNAARQKLCPGGQRLRGRGRGSVAARRPGLHSGFVGNGRAGRQRAGQRRRLPGARLHGPGRSALGPVRARHPGGPDQRHRARAYRPGGHRGHRSPDPGRHGSHAGGCRSGSQPVARGRRGQPQQYAHAVPGRPHRRGRGTPGGDGNHGSGGGLPGGSGRGLLAGRGGNGLPLATGPPL